MSQNEQILKALRKGKTLDPLGVLYGFDCWSLRSRISEIEGKSGHKRLLADDEMIAHIPVHNRARGKHHMSYKLIKIRRKAA